MIDTKKIIASAEAKLAGVESSDLFVVHCTCSPSNEVELFVDSDTRVTIEACAALSRAIEEDFDREAEDFSLTVASAGVGSELRLLRQYNRLIGRTIEILLSNGEKIVGELVSANEDRVEVRYERKELVEKESGKKKREMVEYQEEYPFEQIKWVKEYLDFK